MPAPDKQRADGLEEELAFWREELTGRGKFGDHIGLRLNKQLRHQEHPEWMDLYLERRHEFFGDQPIQMLDLGSGPVSTLGWLADQGKFHVTAADPLGDAYCKLLDELNIDFPLRPRRAGAENLQAVFGPQAFHVIHSRNALDHAEDIAASALQIHACLKPGGFFFLEVFAYEGAQQSYDGLHQFDFAAEDSKLVCRDQDGALIPAFLPEHFELLWITPAASSAYSPGMDPEFIRVIYRRVD